MLSILTAVGVYCDRKLDKQAGEVAVRKIRMFLAEAEREEGKWRGYRRV